MSNSANDKTVVEFKLASAGKSTIKHALQAQLPIYLAANSTNKAVFILAYFTDKQKEMVETVLQELGLDNHPHIFIIDTRKKISASRLNAVA
ncbi:MAG: hypothetical protein JWP12_1611 [Bacteroidetes bacterium]|nr:hypothetical protein [Bacteroidota bacterium]